MKEFYSPCMKLCALHSQTKLPKVHFLRILRDSLMLELLWEFLAICLASRSLIFPLFSSWGAIRVLFSNTPYLLTYSMVKSPSWAADWLAASQEIPRISRNPKVHHRTHKRTPPVPILGLFSNRKRNSSSSHSVAEHAFFGITFRAVSLMKDAFVHWQMIWRRYAFEVWSLCDVVG